jgi:succinate dehydrogenase hydrophobic anchor subunit
LVIQEFLLLRFDNLILQVLVELVLLVAFTHTGHTYDKMHKINAMHSTKIFSMTCMNVKNNL